MLICRDFPRILIVEKRTIVFQFIQYCTFTGGFLYWQDLYDVLPMSHAKGQNVAGAVIRQTALDRRSRSIRTTGNRSYAAYYHANRTWIEKGTFDVFINL